MTEDIDSDEPELKLPETESRLIDGDEETVALALGIGEFNG